MRLNQKKRYEMIDKVNKAQIRLSKDYELKLFGAETNHFIDLFYKEVINIIKES